MLRKEGEGTPVRGPCLDGKTLNVHPLLWTIQDILTNRRRPSILLLHEEKVVVERLKEIFTQKEFPVQVADSFNQTEGRKERPGVIMVGEKTLVKLRELVVIKEEEQPLTIVLEEEKKGDDDEQSTSKNPFPPGPEDLRDSGRLSQEGHPYPG